MFSLFLLLLASPSGTEKVNSLSGCESLLKSGIGLKDSMLGVRPGYGEMLAESTLLAESMIGIKLKLSIWSVCSPGISNCWFLP